MADTCPSLDEALAILARAVRNYDQTWNDIVVAEQRKKDFFERECEAMEPCDLDPRSAILRGLRRQALEARAASLDAESKTLRAVRAVVAAMPRAGE
jgi:hypothetical protein